jgi:hypothetical protein
MAMMAASKVQHWFGLAAGPSAWALSTEFNYALAGWQCEHNTNLTLPAGVLLGLMAVAGAMICARALRIETGAAGLLAGIGLQLDLLSAAIVFTQGAASVVVDACAR